MSEAKAAINVDGLQALIGALAARGYKVLGPAVRDGAIVYDEIEGVADLPAGWTDGQDAGRYRLERRGDDALFGFAHGPQSWKRYLHPPMQTLWTAKKNGEGLKIVPADPPDQKFACVGARSCELHAIAIQDKVFQGGPFVEHGLRGAAPGRLHRRGELRRGRRNVLLRVHENGSESRNRVAISP